MKTLENLTTFATQNRRPNSPWSSLLVKTVFLAHLSISAFSSVSFSAGTDITSPSCECQNVPQDKPSADSGERLWKMILRDQDPRRVLLNQDRNFLLFLQYSPHHQDHPSSYKYCTPFPLEYSAQICGEPKTQYLWFSVPGGHCGRGQTSVL